MAVTPDGRGLYLDVAEIPGNPVGHHGRPSLWPWAEWRKLPPGKALRVELPPGRTAREVARRIRSTSRMAPGVKFALRGEELYVYRPREAEAK